MATFNRRSRRQDRNGHRRAGAKVIVTEECYAEGEVVPMDDGAYEALEPSRRLALSPGHYVTTVGPTDRALHGLSG